MPEAEGPDGLKNEVQRWAERLDSIPEKYQPIVLAERPIEIRAVNPVDSLTPDAKPAEHKLWVRADGTLPDDHALHCYLLAYCSDFSFMTTAMRLKFLFLRKNGAGRYTRN